MYFSIWPSNGYLDFGKGMVMDYRSYCTDDSMESWEAGTEAREERVQQLMSQNFAHDDCAFENINNHLGSATADEVESMEEYLRNKDFEKFGRLVWSISYKYCKHFAEEQAKDEFFDGKLKDDDYE